MNHHKKQFIAISKKETFIFSFCSQLEEKLGISLDEKELKELIEKDLFIRTLQGNFYFDYTL